MGKTTRPAGRLTGVSAAFDGARLTLARHLAGLKKIRLAQLIDMTPASVTAWENNSKKPTASNVAKLALALDVEPQFFAPGNEAGAIVSAPHFRSLRSTTQAAQDKARAYGTLVGQIGILLEKSVEFPPLSVPSAPLSATEFSSGGPEEAARRARADIGVPEGPIANMIRLVESLGVLVVFSAPDTASIDAFSMEVGSRPIIVLNPNKDDYYRQRFDIAHELGHLVMHADAEPGGKIAEDQANRFAAEFLMPAEEVEQYLPRTTTERGWDRLRQLKEHWGVSMQALLFRARALGVMSDVSYRNAMMRVSASGWRRAEPGNVTVVEMPSLIPRAVEVLEAAHVPAADLVRGSGLPLPVVELVASRTPNRVQSMRDTPAASPNGVVAALFRIKDEDGGGHRLE